MSIGRPCRLRQSRVKAHDLLLIKFQLQVLELNLVYQLSDHLFINDPNLVSAWLNPWFQLSVVRKPRHLRTIKTQTSIRSLQLAIETPQRTIWFRQGTNRFYKRKRKQVSERYVSGYQWIILRFNNSVNAINESWKLSSYLSSNSTSAETVAPITALDLSSRTMI